MNTPNDKQTTMNTPNDKQTTPESPLDGAACSPSVSDTPETDADRYSAYGYESELGFGVDFDKDDEGAWVPTKTAQRLERERDAYHKIADEALDACAYLRGSGHHTGFSL